EANKLIATVSGVRQVTTLAAILQNIATVNEVYQKSLKASNKISQDAAIAQDSLENKLTKVAERWRELIGDIGSSDAFRNMATAAVRLADSLTSVAESASSLLPLLAALGTARL